MQGFYKGLIEMLQDLQKEAQGFGVFVTLHWFSMGDTPDDFLAA